MIRENFVLSHIFRRGLLKLIQTILILVKKLEYCPLLYRKSFRHEIYLHIYTSLLFWGKNKKNLDSSIGCCSEAQQKNFRMLIELLEKSSIDYKWVPIKGHSEFYSRLAIPFAQKKKFSEALNNSHHNWKARTQKSWIKSGIEITKLPLTTLISDKGRNSVWNFYLGHVNPYSESISEKCSCQVDFYTLDSDGYIKLNAPNDITSLVDPMNVESVYIHGITVPTWAVFKNCKSLTACDFDVDLVYTWVDGNDPDWLAVKSKYEMSLNESKHKEAIDAGRFTCRHELKFSLRSIAFNSNCFRHIYIVTSGQIPKWLNVNHPKISIITHKQIFREPEISLPTFNSHAIESNLHRIPGIARRFVYLCDDFMFPSNVESKDFFTSLGKPYVFLNHGRNFGFVPPNNSANPFVNAGRNAMKIIWDEFNLVASSPTKHCPQVQDTDISNEIETKYQQALLTTEGNRFRDQNDIPLSSFLALAWGLANGNSIEGVLEATTISLTDKLDMSVALMRLATFKDKKFLCLNEGLKFPKQIQNRIDEEALAFMETLFPQQSEFEH